MAIYRWDPFRDLLIARAAMDRLFQEAPAARSETAGPPMDITEDDNAYRVRLAVPGVKPEDVELRMEQQVLTVRGEVRPEEGPANRRTLHSEHAYGAFSRSVALPGAVDANKASAQFADGMLTITLPKQAAAQPRRIPVGAGASGGSVGQGQVTAGKEEGAPKEAAPGQQVAKEQDVPLRP